MRRWLLSVGLVLAACSTTADDDAAPKAPERTTPETPVSTNSTVQPNAQPPHVFPLTPAGAGSYSDGGHSYPATDIFAPEGTDFVAVTHGVVNAIRTEDRWDPATDDPAERGGRFVAIIGDDGVRYYGSHLSDVTAGLTIGTRVRAGDRLGSVGRSGNARDTPPHLHFGISQPTFADDWEARRGQIAPKPFLDAWRSGDDASTPAVDLISRD